MNNQEFKTEKTTVECYKIRHATRGWWADITIDVTGEKSGGISISSDFGNYANYWNACGKGFKMFLIGLTIDYAANKFGADRYFDLEKTLTSYKIDVLRNRRCEDIDAKKACLIWDEISELEDCSSLSEFQVTMYGQRNLMWMYDHCPDVSYIINPQFKMFWDTIWPVFIAELEKECVVMWRKEEQ